MWWFCQNLQKFCAWHPLPFVVVSLYKVGIFLEEYASRSHCAEVPNSSFQSKIGSHD